MGVKFDGTFRGFAVGAFGGGGQAFFAQPIDGFVDIAVGLFQGLFAVEHSGAGGFAQLLD